MADDTGVTFESLGLNEQLLSAIARLRYKAPTDIQRECLPHALSGRDIIGLAPTGSGKTAAFAIPIIQKLWDAPQGLFACVLAPTRELAYQISAQFEALGEAIGIRCLVVVGGEVDRVAQAIALAKRPHILVATPGRLADHIRSTKGFSLRTLKFLVLDEADRLLDLDFGTHIDELLKAIPKERTTYLFSATMTTKVSKLQRASLTDPVRIETSTSRHTVATLQQYYVLCPLPQKEALLVHLVNTLSQNSMIIFSRTISGVQRLSIILRILDFSVVPLHGELTQSQRLGALNMFKSGKRTVLIATDIASRGLDIPLVDVVINYDVPMHSKDYIHRVGRTARAGRAGKAILIVTQYDVECLQRLENTLDKKLELWPTDKNEMMLIRARVDEAGRVAATELRDKGRREKPKGRRKEKRNVDDRDRDDDILEAGMPSVLPQHSLKTHSFTVGLPGDHEDRTHCHYRESRHARETVPRVHRDNHMPWRSGSEVHGHHRSANLNLASVRESHSLRMRFRFQRFNTTGSQTSRFAKLEKI
ncbi:ATP-dependent rRNA helicase rrp3 [Grifola frondosa]|uniref:ATP-dependent rRNA helicase RRP3 n=1 Tax=Grifola frondosa TaxID=5627 RepID=A0A1C7M0V6_GRIFR|nr:ATP-dependent rRNA helicase rrp3 [Grifola frondosa]